MGGTFELNGLSIVDKTRIEFKSKPDHFSSKSIFSMVFHQSYLIYFSNTYHGFRLPELDSLLTLFGYSKEGVYNPFSASFFALFIVLN